jgi:hypothetical protein
MPDPEAWTKGVIRKIDTLRRPSMIDAAFMARAYNKERKNSMTSNIRAHGHERASSLDAEAHHAFEEAGKETSIAVVTAEGDSESEGVSDDGLEGLAEGI